MPDESVATGSEIWESQSGRNFVLHSLNASVRGSGANCRLAVGGASLVEMILADDFGCWFEVIKRTGIITESLILAQDERWRRA